MIGGIIGDIVGSVYEGKQWDKRDLELFQAFPFTDVSDILKNTKWVRTTPGWTDDSLCILALFSAYINKLSPVSELVRCCKNMRLTRQVLVVILLSGQIILFLMDLTLMVLS